MIHKIKKVFMMVVVIIMALPALVCATAVKSTGSVSPQVKYDVEASAWKPTTEDELYRYSFVDPELPVAEVLAADYEVEIVNSSQGPKFFEVIEEQVGDYQIARTYSFLPNGKEEYKMDTIASIELKIPESLIEANRSFVLVTVDELGKPVIFEDLDSNDTMISIQTKQFYAFALCYMDEN